MPWGSLGRSRGLGGKGISSHEIRFQTAELGVGGSAAYAYIGPAAHRP
jgi:hypothetical protein